MVPAKSAWRPADGRAATARTPRRSSPGAVAEPDERPRQERPIRRAERPADDDRAFERDAGRDVDDDALAPQRPGELGELVVGRERPGRRSSSVANRVGVAREEAPSVGRATPAAARIG